MNALYRNIRTKLQNYFRICKRSSFFFLFLPVLPTLVVKTRELPYMRVITTIIYTIIHAKDGKRICKKRLGFRAKEERCCVHLSSFISHAG